MTISHSNGERAYVEYDTLAPLIDAEFIEVTGDIGDYDPMEAVTPQVDLTVKMDLSSLALNDLCHDVRQYLMAANGGEVTEEEVLEMVSTEIEVAFDIVMNRIGRDLPNQDVYKRVNDEQWAEADAEEYYQEYKAILDELTHEVTDDGETPSVKGLYGPFLAKVAEADEYELPPKGAVHTILKEHIKDVKAEQQSREGVSKVKQELEQNGVDARTAARVAREVDDYIKPDAEI